MSGSEFLQAFALQHPGYATAAFLGIAWVIATWIRQM